MRRACLIVTVLLLALGLACLPGCDSPADLLSQANGYTAAVAVNMQLRGWSDFPSTAVDLARYVVDLKASIADAKAGVTTEGVGGDVDEGAVRGSGGGVRGLGEAFKLPKGSGE